MEVAHITCPLCHEAVDKMLYRYHIDGERRIIARIREQNPAWTEQDGICSRCLDYYHSEIVMKQRILPEIGPYFPVRAADDFIILPTGLRLDADQRYTGKGVTICFIDSGFCRHPDLTAYYNRIKEIIDVTKLDSAPGTLPFMIEEAYEESSSWHGTMTSVVCAGDGYLSNGLYKGIANEALVVLIKVQDKAGKISSGSIEKALEWVLENHKQYDIRIVNMSVGADEMISCKISRIDQLAEKLITEGVTIVAAAGNDDKTMIKPPANSTHVITVGGTDDDNKLNNTSLKLYHSAFGQTTDAIMKPELIAPAIWIAAPILPGTKEQRHAEFLHHLVKQPDKIITKELENYENNIEWDLSQLQSGNFQTPREAIKRRIQACKYISPHYMHVDGTSFAAPIVSAVIAQMLEANPSLTPLAIREVLFSSAKRIEGLPAERQGFGYIRPRKSLLKVLNRDQIQPPAISPIVNHDRKTIFFYFRHDCASQVCLAGNFNYWAHDVLLMEPGINGVWKIDIPLLPSGKYLYKFFVDNNKWIEDVNNPYREPDGFGGINSILMIEN